MPRSRPFVFPNSQAGVFHVVSRIAGKAYFLEEGQGRDEFVKMIRAYEDVCGVEVLTYCVMSNHFHLLVRVPHRPEGFDVPNKLPRKMNANKLPRKMNECSKREQNKYCRNQFHQ